VKIEKKRAQIDFLTITFFFILFVFISTGGHPCFADDQDSNEQNCIEQFEHGSLNWSTGTLRIIGKASPEEKKESYLESVLGSARADANRKLIDILMQIHITNNITVNEYASKSDIILAGIEKTARDAVITRQYYTSALSVEIIIETSILGGFLQLILPDEIRQITKINPEEKIDNKKSVSENLFTGLVVDARSLEIKPLLNPIIVSEQGHDVYSPVFVSREFAVQNGICNYICAMDQAIADKRIGDNPLIFKGLRKAGEENSTIVISMSDYRELEKATERHQFLKECRVIIVID
jgi:hypothetical protein